GSAANTNCLTICIQQFTDTDGPADGASGKSGGRPLTGGTGEPCHAGTSHLVKHKRFINSIFDALEDRRGPRKKSRREPRSNNCIFKCNPIGLVREPGDGYRAWLLC